MNDPLRDKLMAEVMAVLHKHEYDSVLMQCDCYPSHKSVTMDYGEWLCHIERILSETPATVFGPGDYSCVSCGMGMIEPCEHWKAELAKPAAPAASAPDGRTLQDVLRLHKASYEGMLHTYERVGKPEEVAYAKGQMAGIDRAIEVADNRAPEPIRWPVASAPDEIQCPHGYVHGDCIKCAPSIDLSEYRSGRRTLAEKQAAKPSSPSVDSPFVTLTLDQFSKMADYEIEAKRLRADSPSVDSRALLEALAREARDLVDGMRHRTGRDPDVADFLACFKRVEATLATETRK